MLYYHKIDALSAFHNLKALNELFLVSPELFTNESYSLNAVSKSNSHALRIFWLNLYLVHGININYDFSIFNSYDNIKFWYNAILEHGMILPELSDGSLVSVEYDCKSKKIIEVMDMMYELYGECKIFRFLIEIFCAPDIIYWIFDKKYIPPIPIVIWNDMGSDVLNFIENKMIDTYEFICMVDAFNDELSVLNNVHSNMSYHIFAKTNKNQIPDHKIAFLLEIYERCYRFTARSNNFQMRSEIIEKIMNYSLSNDLDPPNIELEYMQNHSVLKSYPDRILEKYYLSCPEKCDMWIEYIFKHFNFLTWTYKQEFDLDQINYLYSKGLKIGSRAVLDNCTKKTMVLWNDFASSKGESLFNLVDIPDTAWDSISELVKDGIIDFHPDDFPISSYKDYINLMQLCEKTGSNAKPCDDPYIIFDCMVFDNYIKTCDLSLKLSLSDLVKTKRHEIGHCKNLFDRIFKYYSLDEIHNDIEALLIIASDTDLKKNTDAVFEILDEKQVTFSFDKFNELLESSKYILENDKYVKLCLEARGLI